MENYELLVKLITTNSANINFAEFGDGVSDSWIKKAQERLKVVFPPSYIWWLKNYGGGEVLGDEIYSVYELDFDEVVGGDIVYMNELNRKNKTSNETKLIIQETDMAEVFYFDLIHPDKNGEYPVCRSFADNIVKYADSFGDFLKRRITDKY